VAAVVVAQQDAAAVEARLILQRLRGAPVERHKVVAVAAAVLVVPPIAGTGMRHSS
jgi:hypothetical protein